MFTCKLFRMNVSKDLSQVLILNSLQKSLSSLESAFTKNGGGEYTESYC